MKTIKKIIVYYSDGTFDEMYKMGGSPGEIPCAPYPNYPAPPRPYTTTGFDTGCKVCGLGVNGECTGYYCTRGDCPTRVTS